MKVYRISKYCAKDEWDDGHQGYEYFSSKKAAEKAVREMKQYSGIDQEVDLFDIPLTKDGILSHLNRHCVHNDNG